MHKRTPCPSAKSVFFYLRAWKYVQGTEQGEVNFGYFYVEENRQSKEDFNGSKTIKNLAFEVKDGKLKISDQYLQTGRFQMRES